MNKTRLEALSDGVFSIAMTLLIIDVTVPHLGEVSDGAILDALTHLIPVIVSYFVSFIVLAMFWISHNYFYEAITKNINRILTLINILFLSLIAFIPFSAHLIGAYPTSRVAVMLYGFNILLIASSQFAALLYAMKSDELHTEHVSRRLKIQATLRNGLTLGGTLLGIMFASLGFLSFAIFLYGLPIFFNLIPGLLDALERSLGLRFD